MEKNIMDISLNDIVRSAREKASGLKDKVEEEAEDLKRVWFKHVLGSLEKLGDRVESIRADFRSADRKIAELEKRIKELESHECKCSESEIPVVRHGGPH